MEFHIDMEITRGKQEKAQKVVVYGPEGVGKSTFASKFPKPLYIDVEGSTAQFDVDRTPRPSSWTMLKATVSALKRDNHGYQTLVIDTADWAERMGIEELCAANNILALGGENDYGRSYGMWRKEWGTFLDALTELVEGGMHVVLLAHTAIRTQQVPEEFGAYDHWELKLEKKTSALTKEWADMLLFANYKTIVVEDSKTKSKKAQGGARALYTTHHPCWDAKHRHGLADELPMEFSAIAHCFPVLAPGAASAPTAKPESAAEPAKQPAAEPKAYTALAKLRDLMAQDNITTKDVQAAMAAYGHRPAGTPLESLDEKYIMGGLIANWGKVKDKIRSIAA